MLWICYHTGSILHFLVRMSVYTWRVLLGEATFYNTHNRWWQRYVKWRKRSRTHTYTRVRLSKVAVFIILLFLTTPEKFTAVVQSRRMVLWMFSRFLKACMNSSCMLSRLKLKYYRKNICNESCRYFWFYISEKQTLIFRLLQLLFLQNNKFKVGSLKPTEN